MNIEVGRTYQFVFNKELGGASEVEELNGQNCVIECIHDNTYKGQIGYTVRFPNGDKKMVYESELLAPYIDPHLLQSVSAIKCRGVNI